jgi:2',3'-cyclic-nucleotide 2'-phosphodiesterase (5'-nucleotidase family)/endonuclease/exonuclease/phosphatase family metal-dependent hydrolase
VAVSPTSNFRSNSEIWVLANQGANATGLNSQGGITIVETDFNPERIQIDDELLRTLFQDRNGNSIVSLPQINVGFLLGDVTGVSSFAFGNYEILATEPFNSISGGLKPEVTEIVGTDDRLTVASYNVENLNPFAGIRFEALASQVVNNLKSPDIIALQEIQDNNGPIDDGTVAADLTYQFFIDAITAADGSTYEFVNIDPENNQDGGQPGSNIRVGYLYNPERVELVPDSVRRIVDTDLSDGDAFEASRKPLVATFLFNGQEVTTINNHLTSRGGSSPLFGTIQPPRIRGEEAREAQAQILNAEVNAILSADANANVVVLGDFNGFDFEEFQRILQGGDAPVLQNLNETLPERERYTFNFQGNSQALDHLLVSNNLAANAEYDIVHVNVDYVDQQADHEPLLASLSLSNDASPDDESVRFASYNVALNRSTAGRLFEDLSTPDQQQPRNVAEIIQRVNPDVLLINEFDFDAENPLQNPQLFIENYLEVQQHPDVEPVTYDYIYIAPSNTGIASGFDLDRDGRIVTIPETPGFGNDAWGFGNFPGQFAMVLLSKYPIVTEEVRTFQNFLWKDMPGAVLPDDINTPEPNDWYSPEILEQFRLSSKSHWDVPIDVNGTVIHVLASHPTPPVFDGPENRNGLRNTDEIRFWSDYVTPNQGDYIYDDNGGIGGLEDGSHFVIMGDQNADPFDGSSTPPATLQLLENPNIQGSVDDPAITPSSEGGVAATNRQGGINLTHEGNPAFDTADFNDENPGNLRADYVLPSNNLEIDPENKGVFWLTEEDPNFERLIGDFNPDLDRENFPEGFLSSDHRLVYMDVTPVTNPDPQPFTLQILHTSDQEAGVPAFQDIPGLSAVMNALDGRYENSLKLTTGDVYIASPFFNASRDLYNNATTGNPVDQPGIADILIQNALGWDVASIGNHEFTGGDSTLLNLVAANPNWVNGNGGVGIGEGGYPGTLFPYLANNLDYSNARLPDGLAVVENGSAPLPNTLTGSVVVDVNGEDIGLIGIVTPYLKSIANTGLVEVTTLDAEGNEITGTSPINVQVDSIIANITPEVETLTQGGINKIILMTHLQESAIEQALAQQMADLGLEVDILFGGGSHRLMASEGGLPFREDETQQTTGQLLQPFPQEFASGDNKVLYVNSAANYRYLNQLVVTFDENGVVSDIGDDSGAYATDIAGVARLYGEDITTPEQVNAKADPTIVEIIDGVQGFVNELDGNIFGQADVFLNGIRGDVRTQETNLGNLLADAQSFYAEAYLAEYDLLSGLTKIDISFQNGGSIRDFIGQSLVVDDELLKLPTAANPEVDKEEGDISQLDLSNSFRFDSDLMVGTVDAEGFLALAEHMISSVETGNGRFGQIGGFRFSFDPNVPAGSRIRNLALADETGSSVEAIVQDGELVVDSSRTFSVVTSTFLANGGDSYPTVIENVVSLLDFEEPDSLGLANLQPGRQQDAVGEYLAAFFNVENGQVPYSEVDTPQTEDNRVQNLGFREDTILDDLLSGGISGVSNAVAFGALGSDLATEVSLGSVLQGPLVEANVLTGVIGNDVFLADAAVDLATFNAPELVF